MKFDVKLDVTMSGTIEVEADSQKEAMVIAKNKQFVPSDLRNFYWVGNDVEEAEPYLEESEEKQG
jgi:hypothetical protein